MPALANQCKDGTNTFSHDWEHFLPWERWAEFNAENLYGMFRHVLEAEWQAPANLACALLEEDKSFAAEDMLEHQVLSRVVIPVVNAALQHACRLQGVGYTLFITRHGGSTFAGSRFRPDWVLCSTTHITDHGYYVPRMAGDTKESVKFHSARVTLHGPDSDSAYPVRQAVSYAVDAGARYTFIITDAELVVLRVTSMHTGSGIAATRPRRPPQPVQFGHASHPSTGTAISQISDRLMATSIADSAASYQPAPATDVPFVEYQTVPWANHNSSGQGLTVGLALFYLALLSGLGTSNLQFQYPTLDSCWPAVSGRFYHNSTGLASKTPMAGLEHPDPSADRAARWVSVPGLDGTPMDCITFESAVMQDAEDGHREVRLISHNRQGNSQLDPPVGEGLPGEELQVSTSASWARSRA